MCFSKLLAIHTCVYNFCFCGYKPMEFDPQNRGRGLRHPFPSQAARARDQSVPARHSLWFSPVSREGHTNSGNQFHWQTPRARTGSQHQPAPTALLPRHQTPNPCSFRETILCSSWVTCKSGNVRSQRWNSWTWTWTPPSWAAPCDPAVNSERRVCRSKRVRLTTHGVGHFESK